MKKTTLLLAVTIMSMTGCSKTWSGIKQDTSEAFENTKSVIHEATSPAQVPVASNPYGNDSVTQTPTTQSSNMIQTPTVNQTSTANQNTTVITTPSAPASSTVVEPVVNVE